MSSNLDRFELEQQILQCWNVTSDIDMLYEGVMEYNLTQDQIANCLLGLHQMYELKFKKLFSTFETLVAERKIV